MALTPERLEIQKLARQFARKELLPVAALFDEKEEFPKETYRKLVETGLHAVGFPEAYGGAGDLLALALVAEELARADAGFILSVLASSQLFGYNVARLGTPAQKDRYLKG